MAAASTTYPAPDRPHFLVLDGLRGVAAFCVVLYHFTVSLCDLGLGVCHGFLAVDFFFCLSGYVIGYAYTDRLQTLGARRFLVLRLVRLHPMVVFGTAFGLLVSYTDVLQHAAWSQFTACCASLLMIPYREAQQSSPHLFRLNAPAWSLFWEYVANVLFAVALFRIRRNTLIAFTVVAAVNLCVAGYRAGNLAGGSTLHDVPIGAARLAFSFSMGLLLSRLRWRWRSPAGLLWLTILLVLPLLLPFTLGGWIQEAALIILYFPSVVLLGAGAHAGPASSRACIFLGRLSYPLYMAHYPVVRVWDRFLSEHVLTPVQLWLSTGVGIGSAVAAGWLALRFWDEPMRNYMHQRLAR